ncbi:xylulokinase [Hydrogenispora ethanolica]|uniref:Xylulokinase n=1 Tax=Hydrogenispora ethanolica TaxID=1082276 RepID=A0A4R1SA19_HYDET|nr:FGGY-family carbohydrate kinase [Hydrogenispora ethanolica]TCL76281.1 xylulokinase [Hydrogenispora ethanolica]
MEKRLLLGIDIGTSGCKLTVFDFDGRVLAGAAGTYPTAHPAPGWVEQDAEQWWTVVRRELRGLMTGAPVDPRAIAAIGIDGTSWACLPVDASGKPLRPALLWLDRRAEAQAAWLREQFGAAELSAVSGNPVDPAYITPKILWLKEREPQIYRQTRRFLQSNAYIGFKLTGAYSQDYSQGYGFHFFEIAKGDWSEELAEKMGISLEVLAPLVHCHEVIGTVTRSAAEETGLIPGIPVVAGGLDAACCTLGAGVIRPGQTQEQGGQAGGMSIQLERPLVHPRLILGYHVLPGQWLLQGGTVGGGGALRWFNEQLGGFEQELGRQLGRSSFEWMSEAAATVPPGADGLLFLPYMAGERSPLWNSKARGVFFGLSYDKTRAHLIRAVMEGVGYSLLHNLETAREAQATVEQLVSVGGSANSAVWTQIKADITGKVIRVPFSDHATTLGAALLAGVGTGVYPDFETAVGRTVRVQRTYTPDPARHAVYQEFYQLYRELYHQLVGCYDRLDAIVRSTADLMKEQNVSEGASS